jgi:hypothetical protein
MDLNEVAYMALSKKENAILEAVSSMLQQSSKLGLQDSGEETSHNSQFRWEGIDDAFALKVNDLTFYEAVTSAFHKVHSYKYIDHPTFKLALVTELKSRAVPQVEIDEACKAVDGLLNELSADKPSERDAGWHPNIDEIADMTRNADNRKAKRDEPFTGGGPWAEDFVKGHHELYVIEGLLPEGEKAARYVGAFKTLEESTWSAARPRLMQLAESARRESFEDFARHVEQFIDFKDNESMKDILEG